MLFYKFNSITGNVTGRQYRIQISDTGSGIQPEDLPHIYNPFFSTKADGAGIDLAIVKRIMANHGGNIDVVSRPNKETTFSLTFPLERRRAMRISHLDHSENSL